MWPSAARPAWGRPSSPQTGHLLCQLPLLLGATSSDPANTELGHQAPPARLRSGVASSRRTGQDATEKPAGPCRRPCHRLHAGSSREMTGRATVPGSAGVSQHPPPELLLCCGDSPHTGGGQALPTQPVLQGPPGSDPCPSVCTESANSSVSKQGWAGPGPRRAPLPTPPATPRGCCSEPHSWTPLRPVAQGLQRGWTGFPRVEDPGGRARPTPSEGPAQLLSLGSSQGRV